MMDANPTFGDLIRYCRKSAGLTQRALAQLLEVSEPYLSDVERNRRGPLSPEKTILACRRLGISMLAEVKARATSLGFFTLQAEPQNRPAMQAAGLLAIAWPHLKTADVQRIARIAGSALAEARVEAKLPPE